MSWVTDVVSHLGTNHADREKASGWVMSDGDVGLPFTTRSPSDATSPMEPAAKSHHASRVDARRLPQSIAGASAIVIAM